MGNILPEVWLQTIIRPSLDGDPNALRLRLFRIAGHIYQHTKHESPQRYRITYATASSISTPLYPESELCSCDMN